MTRWNVTDADVLAVLLEAARNVTDADVLAVLLKAAESPWITNDTAMIESLAAQLVACREALRETMQDATALHDELTRLRAVREAAARLAALWTTDSIYPDEQAALAALHAALDDDGSVR